MQHKTTTTTTKDCWEIKDSCETNKAFLVVFLIHSISFVVSKAPTCALHKSQTELLCIKIERYLYQFLRADSSVKSNELTVI